MISDSIDKLQGRWSALAGVGSAHGGFRLRDRLIELDVRVEPVTVAGADHGFIGTDIDPLIKRTVGHFTGNLFGQIG